MPPALEKKVSRSAFHVTAEKYPRQLTRLADRYALRPRLMRPDLGRIPMLFARP